MSETYDDLEKRRDAIRQEISTLDEAIIDMEATGKAGQNNTDQLQTIKTARATRQRELKDVEAQLAKRS